MLAPMKSTLLQTGRVQRVIASFGRARLIRHLNGTFELREGSPSERQDVREWVSLFFHEATLHESRNGGPAGS
ncbi:MAG TPA: hypothetical protein DCY13_07630 [Verrucomicrobiales bacterium]|nr:hypothetical protein [Verrucomicrobiales bacterium]